MKNTFSIKESFSFGWKAFTARPWLFIGVIVATCVIIGLSSAIFAPKQGGNLIYSLINATIGIFVDMGLITFALKAHENVQSVTWKTLWAPYQFWKYLGAAILVGIAVVVGFILLIIPGIIAALGLMFTKYLVIDRKLKPVDAMKESWRITKGQKLQLFGFVIVAALLNIAGAILLLLGLLVTIPVTMLAAVHVYRTLEHAAHEVAAA